MAQAYPKKWAKSARALCNECKKGKVTFGDKAYYIRKFTTLQQEDMRVELLMASQTVDTDLIDVRQGVVDGAHLRLKERVYDSVQSVATGGYGKTDCFYDPTPSQQKRVIERYIKLTMLYSHKEYCLAELIGSEAQDGQNGTMQLLSNSSSMHEIRRDGQRALDDKFIDEQVGMARAVDKNNILGNYVDFGTNKRPISNMANHYNGWIPLTLLASKAKKFHTVDWELPTFNGGAYMFEYEGKYLEVTGSATVITTIVLLAEALNEFTDSVTGAKLFTAGVTPDGKLRVVAQNCVENLLRHSGLKIYYFEDGNYDGCAEPLECEVIQDYSEINQTPYIKEFSRPTKENIYEYLLDAICGIEDHVANCKSQGYVIPTGHFMYIDPRWLTWMKFARIIDSKGDCCSSDFESRLDGVMPRFIPLEALRGTDLWLWSVPKNLMYFTNIENLRGNSNRFSDQIRGYKEECGKLWSKNEILSGAAIWDYCLVATNACNAPIDKNLSYDLFEERNMDHMPRPPRPDACITGTVSNVEAVADVCKTLVDENDPSLGYTITIDGTNSQGEIAEYEWLVATQDNTVIPPIATESGEFVVLPAALMNMSTISLTVTDTSGNESTDVVIMSTIPNCEDC